MSCLLDHVYPICLMPGLDPNEFLLGRLAGAAISLSLAVVVYALLRL